MASRLTDKQKKKIVADFVMLRSYSAVGKLNGISDKTVKKYVEEDPEFTELSEQKKEENTADILAYMEKQREAVCDIIGVGLECLPEKIKTAKSASEITTAIGTLIDKWALISGAPVEKAKDDALSKSLRELAKGLTSDDKP